MSKKSPPKKKTKLLIGLLLFGLLAIASVTWWSLSLYYFQAEGISQKRQNVSIEIKQKLQNIASNTPGMTVYANTTLDQCAKGFSPGAFEPKNYRYTCYFSQTDYAGYKGSRSDLANSLHQSLLQNGFVASVYKDRYGLQYTNGLPATVEQGTSSIEGSYRKFADSPDQTDIRLLNVFVIIAAKESPSELWNYEENSTSRYIYRAETSIDKPAVVGAIQAQNQYIIKISMDQTYFTQETLWRQLTGRL